MLHCVINRKFLIDHAKLNVLTKRFNLFDHIFSIVNSEMENKANIMLTKPGRPKLVFSALIPVMVVLIDSIYTHGKKQATINPIAAITPICFEYFISETKKWITLSNPFWGPERIRTAVEAFAELCLSHSATGPFFRDCEFKAKHLIAKLKCWIKVSFYCFLNWFVNQNRPYCFGQFISNRFIRKW